VFAAELAPRFRFVVKNEGHEAYVAALLGVNLDGIVTS
jgi:hypothetical protein